jgi:hypothetical protein
MTALVPESLKNGEYGVLFIIGHAIKNAHVRLGRLVGLTPPPRGGGLQSPLVFAVLSVRVRMRSSRRPAIVLASIVWRLFSPLLGLPETPGLKLAGLRLPLGFACENVAALLR